MHTPLPRVQLFEWNDLPWVPAAVRDTIVESLSRTLEWGHVLDGLVEPFERFLAESGATEVLEIGSGGGGPARILARAIAEKGKTPPKFVLTDLHPRVEAWEKMRTELPNVLDFEPSPVDGTRIPEGLARGRARSIVNVLHHFPPSLASAILQDAVRGSRGVFIAEGFERNPLMAANLVPAGIPALMLNPLLSRKDRLAKASLTWFSPVALGMAVWDAVVSTMRVYSEDELRAIVAPFGTGWRWEYGKYSYAPLGEGYFFYGVPR